MPQVAKIRIDGECFTSAPIEMYKSQYISKGMGLGDGAKV